MPENKGKVREDDFVSKICKDPNNPPNALMLFGYVGRSSEEDHTRLYFDPELRNYIEIKDEDILHQQPLPKEASHLGGSYFWINRDAEITHGAVGPQRTKARFFEGPIAAQVAGLAGEVAPHLPTLPGPICLPPTLPQAACPVTVPPGCHTVPGALCPTLSPTIAICCAQTPHLPCPTPLCPTHQPSCVLPLCPTHQPTPCPICPTQVLPLCPTHQPTCALPLCPTHQPSCIPLCPTHQPSCVLPLCPTHQPTCVPLCPTHQPSCVLPACPTHQPTVCLPCPTHQPTPCPVCPTPLCTHAPISQCGPCQTVPLHCPTSVFACNSQICPSATIPCQTVPPGCPIVSAVACPSGAVCGGGPVGGGGGPIA